MSWSRYIISEVLWNTHRVQLSELYFSCNFDLILIKSFPVCFGSTGEVGMKSGIWFTEKVIFPTASALWFAPWQTLVPGISAWNVERGSAAENLPVHISVCFAIIKVNVSFSKMCYVFLIMLQVSDISRCVENIFLDKCLLACGY